MTLVLGAGPAGCAASIALARAGAKVLLLERQAAAQESVCGEFLGPDAEAALRLLGLDLPALGAVPLRRLRIGAGAREAEVALPFPAWALPRRLLDGALRAAAETAGVELRSGIAIAAAEPAPQGWRLRWPGGKAVAPRLILATGKHGLRGHPRAGAPQGALGLKLHLAGVEAGDAVALLPFAGGYAGLQPLPGGGANLCVALHAEGGAAARDPAALLERVAAGSALAARLLRGARPLWDRPLAVAAVPYGFRQGADGPEGLYRIGDQAAVIASFTGAGVALALHSGLAAAAAVLAGDSAARFHLAWRRRSAGPMRWAGLGALALRRAPAGFATAAAFGPAARWMARATRLETEAKW
ncbi:NAD(P)/FAD-dependent oxidoreductase [Siccirubricoccus deserti]|uniref:FAD-dependent oxidoreductase n=1 Tax=Siccirubricoccus deserti TaxID=2013562 RepID=A0A9X0QVZ0_9PROT|nr:FAD-dependent oxidoreductase [Siccirubricoccus deserti]MBC4014467.1 FAD-dependent oxidoreductase [Siccirubricoccus deserti]